MKFQVKVVREVPGEYVREGADYTVTTQHPRRNDQRVTGYHFRNNATDGGTFMAPWAFDAAVKRGDVVKVAG